MNIEVNPLEVRRSLMKKLDPHKAQGPGGISSLVLRVYAETLAS